MRDFFLNAGPHSHVLSTNKVLKQPDRVCRKGKDA